MRPGRQVRRGMRAAALIPLLAVPAALWLQAAAGWGPGWAQGEYRVEQLLNRGGALVYRWVRAYHQAQALRGEEGLLTLAGRHVVVLYPPHLRQDAPLVLRAAEETYGPVMAALGGAGAPQPLPVVIEEPAEMQGPALGSAGTPAPAGIYWRGVIQVLAPSAWIPARTPAERARIFRQVNPLAHELAHAVLDYRTDGNYPRWFSEGLAQRVEADVTGYTLNGPGGFPPPYYTLSQLEDGFDRLPNQMLAYWQSLRLTDVVLARCGPRSGLERLLGALGAGEPFWPALERTCGIRKTDLLGTWEALFRQGPAPGPGTGAGSTGPGQAAPARPGKGAPEPARG